jgi:hypothetical protein
MSVVDSLLTAPLPNLLIVLGAFFVFLAIVGKLTTNTAIGSFDADGKGRMIAAVIGPILIVMGLLVIPSVAPDPTPAPEPELVGVTGERLTENDQTPPGDLTPVDRTVASTPEQETAIPPDPDRTLFEREPNDAALTSMLVEPGATVSGEIRSTYDPDPSMDSDYFAVWVDAGDPITVEVARDSGPGTVYVTVLDPDGRSEPNGDWLSDVITVEGGDRIQIRTVASQSGYHYVLVSGWVYLIDYDLYFNDGGNGGYTVDIGTVDGRASLVDPDRTDLGPTSATPDGSFDRGLAVGRVASGR